MKTFYTKIITPQAKVFDGDVEFLSAPGDEGELGILADHAPIFARLSKGVLALKVSGNEQYYALYAGILEVKPDGNVLILADHADQADSHEQAKQRAASFVERFSNNQQTMALNDGPDL